MPNLMLTNRCNFNCPYCFGVDMMGPGNEKADMTRETFLGLLDWTERKRHESCTVHLMGGEPTLHEDFEWMAKTCASRDMSVKVFSNLASMRAPDHARALKDMPIRWIVNVNPPESRTRDQDKNLRKSLEDLGPKVTLTFNMQPEPCPNEWLIDLITGYGLGRDIKVGFVLPTLSHMNTHLETEDYPKVAQRVVDFSRLCDRFDISLDYECGVPWCSFTPEQLGELWHHNCEFFSSCDSVLDITPDGRVIYCLPLATFAQRRYTEFDNYLEAKLWFEDLLNPYRPLGSTPKCFGCNLLRRGVCRGGCMARVLRGARNVKDMKGADHVSSLGQG